MFLRPLQLWRRKGGEHEMCWEAGCPGKAATETFDEYCKACWVYRSMEAGRCRGDAWAESGEAVSTSQVVVGVCFSVRKPRMGDWTRRQGGAGMSMRAAERRKSEQGFSVG